MCRIFNMPMKHKSDEIEKVFVFTKFNYGSEAQTLSTQYKKNNISLKTAKFV